MASTTYVRHSMAVPAEGVHPTEWVLDERGRAGASELAGRLEVGSGIGALVTSTEPKAVGTAEAIGERWGAEVVLDDRLREAVRPWVGPGYRALVHRYLRGEPQEGWEPYEEVAGRAAEALADARDAAAGAPVVVVSHGLLLAVHLRDRLGDDFDRESFWSRLSFPDAWTLDESGLLHRPAPETSASA